VFLKFWREKKIQELPRTMSQNSVGEEVENSGRVFERLEKKIQGAPADNPIQGGGKSGSVFLKFWREKKIKTYRGHLAQIKGGGGGKFRQSVFEILERKFKGSRGHLAKIQWGGG
jgi:hypothetical protein